MDLNCKFQYLEKAGLLCIHTDADHRALTNKISHHVQVDPGDLLYIITCLKLCSEGPVSKKAMTVLKLRLKLP